MPEERGHWNSRVGFVMAAIGSAVGLGNVWRFPYVCGANGGGAFLIPYFVAILVLGIPLLIMEFGLGHMMLQAAPFSFGKIKRNAEWVGWFAVLVALVITIYYCVIMAWCCNYFVFSFLKTTGADGAVLPIWGSNPGQFFSVDFLHETKSLFPLGGLNLGIVLGLAFTWVYVFLIIYKGVSVVGKVVMWTVPLPIILLAILFGSAVLREGAISGLAHYLTPDFSALAKPSVWRAAFGQVFFSLTLGFGVMIAYASYLKRESDISNNALITTMANCGTSFFAGFAIFSTVGALAFATEQPVAEVANGGPALAFVMYPAAITELGKAAPLFGGMFFLMLLLLGIDSAFSLIEGATSALVEKTGFRRAPVTASLCIICFCLGLVFCTDAGSKWIGWADHICNDIALPLVMLIQCIVVGWFYGAYKLRAHINSVSEISIGRWWTFMIRVVCPLLIGFIFVATTYEDINKRIAGEEPWGPFIGQWALLFVLLIGSILLMLIKRKPIDDKEVSE